MDDALYRATASVLADTGWDGLTLELVAQSAGRGRATLWRNGVTRESLLDGLLGKLAEDYRDAMLPVLTAAGSPRERLERAIRALCDVVDVHSDVLSVSDEMFHRAHETRAVPMKFLDPFIAPIRDARAAGRLRTKSSDVDLADVLFNSVAWTYLHFRVRHRWAAAKTRNLLVSTLLDGLLT